ncbi:MAG: hypothetical protein DRI61_01070 [Chloroflexi bacterium]|nr:MAG: hypothetical protein DRI61_01070 [Chloroflexota bacterium]HDN81076.1 MBL fold metallo-hydrolase [Chloroflexota bacterium]
MIEVQFLGTGAAEGIPAIQCTCEHCRRARLEGGKLRRERSAFILHLPDYKLLVDTPPNIKNMLRSYDISRIDGIFISHEHYDHAGGIEEFSYWGRSIDLFLVPQVYKRLTRNRGIQHLNTRMFNLTVHPGMALHFDGFFLVPFAVKHSVPCFGLAIYQGTTKVVYTSDTSNEFSNYARCLMENADLLIVNTPEFKTSMPDHITIAEAVQLQQSVGAKRLVLTHFNHHNRPHDELESLVTKWPGVTVAYDGLKIRA